MFNHLYYEQVKEPVLKRVDDPKGRYYVDEENNKYTSVTTFLSRFTDQESLQKWREAVGEESARLTSRLATTKGSNLHKAAELFLNNDPNYKKVFTFYDELFDWKIMEPKLKQHIDNIVCQEMMMYSKKIGLAGTADCIAEFDGELSVIDFKTSSSIKHLNDIEHYFLQCACYAIMFYELFSIQIKQLVIFMIVNKDQVLIFKQKSVPWMKKLLTLTESGEHNGKN